MDPPDTDTTDTDTTKIAFDCYNPDAAFSSSCPGLPDFHVAITYYNNRSCSDGAVGTRAQKGLTFGDLRLLLQITAAVTAAGDKPEEAVAAVQVPLKIATVSDSGTVVMFGVTDFGVPAMPLTAPAVTAAALDSNNR